MLYFKLYILLFIIYIFQATDKYILFGEKDNTTSANILRSMESFIRQKIKEMKFKNASVDELLVAINNFRFVELKIAGLRFAVDQLKEDIKKGNQLKNVDSLLLAIETIRSSEDYYQSSIESLTMLVDLENDLKSLFPDLNTTVEKYIREIIQETQHKNASAGMFIL